MKRVLVLWADASSTNLGVQALALGTADLAKRVYGDVEIVTRSYDSRDSADRYLTLTNIAAAAMLRRGELHDWITTFDIVIDTGAGDSFSDIYGKRRLIEMSALRFAIRFADVPLILGPQTIGPFKSKAMRSLAIASIAKASRLMTRDSQSFDNASRMMRPTGIVASCDVVFSLPQPEPTVERYGVLLNVSGLLWEDNPHVDSTYYRESILSLVAELQKRSISVTLLAHVLESDVADSDLKALREVRRLSGENLQILNPTNLSEVRRWIASSELVIGSRMHATLNALSVGVPTIPWSYSPKFTPILQDLEWVDYFDLRDEDTSIVARTVCAAERLMLDGPESGGARNRAIEKLDRSIDQMRNFV